MRSTRFTVDHFIKKFERIPHCNWYAGAFVSPSGKSCCVLGHCGERTGTRTDESRAIQALFWKTPVGILPNNWAFFCNDGDNKWKDYETTPKKRILKALRAIKTAQEGEE